MTMGRATGPYQLLDPLSPEDFAALEADILERGVMVPIEFDEDGNVIDGHHRLMICRKHGITDYPKVIRRGWTEEQKRTHSRRMNLARRHLTREQRRRLIESELRECPGGSNRKIAAALGVDHKTVGNVRSDLETRGEIPHVIRRKAMADTQRPAMGFRHRTVMAAEFTRKASRKHLLDTGHILPIIKA